MLVVDFADDLLDDVLDRDDAVGAAIFVDHQREMDAASPASCASRSITGIDGGTNSISRTILAADSGIDEIDRLEVEAGGKRLLAPGVGLRGSPRRARS